MKLTKVPRPDGLTEKQFLVHLTLELGEYL